VGTHGAIARLDADAGVAVPQSIEGGFVPDQLAAISGTSERDVWVVGAAAPHHFDGTQWTTHQVTSSALTAVWAAAEGDVWAGANNGTALRWDGGTWARYTLWPFAAPVDDLWGASTDDVWALSTFQFAHWDGGAWGQVSLPSGAGGVKALFGLASNDLWAVGTSALHWDGVAWRASFMPSQPLSGVWCSASNDCWAVGGLGIFRWNGIAWSAMTVTPGFEDLSEVWGRGRDDVFVFDAEGRAAHWDGGRFTVMTTGVPTGVALHAWSADGGVWAVGGSSVLVHH
jgi:hypothetical protein